MAIFSYAHIRCAEIYIKETFMKNMNIDDCKLISGGNESGPDDLNEWLRETQELGDEVARIDRELADRNQNGG